MKYFLKFFQNKLCFFPASLSIMLHFTFLLIHPVNKYSTRIYLCMYDIIFIPNFTVNTFLIGLMFRNSLFK